MGATPGDSSCRKDYGHICYAAQLLLLAIFLRDSLRIQSCCNTAYDLWRIFYTKQTFNLLTNINMHAAQRYPFFVLLISLWLSGCASLPKPFIVNDPPLTKPLAITFAKHPVIALVLGGGATRGFAHVGVLNILEEHGIQPNLVVGTSAGAVTGALYAGGIRGEQLESVANELQQEQIADWSYSGRGVIRGELLQNFINQLLRDRPIEHLDTKFVATATDLDTGQLVIFTRGDAGLAVRASSTIPGLVSPVTINGRDYVDGGLVSNVPAALARQLGADIVIAVDVSRSITEHEQLDSTLAVLQQSLEIMQQALTRTDLSAADIVIRPPIGELPFGDFEQKSHAIKAGAAAATIAIPDIQQLLRPKSQE